MISSVYGIGPGTFTANVPTEQTTGTTAYYDLQVTYTQPTNLLLFPGPTINVNRSKRVWVAANFRARFGIRPFAFRKKR